METLYWKVEAKLIKLVFTHEWLMKIAIRRIERTSGHKMTDEEFDKTVKDLMDSYRKVEAA